MNAPRYAALRAGADAFRAGRWFEAHEAWERLFREDEGAYKRLGKALAQLAAAFHKRATGGHAGADRVFAKAAAGVASLVAEGRSACCGVDLVALAAELGRGLGGDPLPERARTLWGPQPTSFGPSGVLYLHGFASGPTSTKARLVEAHLRARSISVAVPDQNEGDFGGLTVGRALALAARSLRERTLIVGSSLGGYVGSLLAAADPRVCGLLLLAPAFDFYPRLLARHGSVAVDAWRQSGVVEVEHYALGGRHPLRATLLLDAATRDPRPRPAVPTRIIHGRRDDTVPVEISRAIAAGRTEVALLEVDDDHALSHSGPLVLGALDEMLAELAIAPDPPALTLPGGEGTPTS